MRPTHWLTLVVPLLAAAACDGGLGSGDALEGGAVPDFGPTAAYERRLIFLGPGFDLPTAAVFDFATVSDSAGVLRGARARLVDGSQWTVLADAAWRMAPLRQPWRLVPHGALKLIVGDAGELDALVYRDEPEVRLDPGAAIAEHSPDAGTQLVLRQGRLDFGSGPVTGIVLDAQLGRAVNAAAAAADTGAMLDPSPAARPSVEALLLDNAGFHVVFALSADGDLAWVHNAGRDDIRRGARLEPMDWVPFEDTRIRVPIAWRVFAAGNELAGELNATAASRTELPANSAASMLGYVVVTGWIEDRGVRRDVFGIVRHVDG